jgi:hypothetical protein
MIWGSMGLCLSSEKCFPVLVECCTYCTREEVSTNFNMFTGVCDVFAGRTKKGQNLNHATWSEFMSCRKIIYEQAEENSILS